MKSRSRRRRSARRLAAMANYAIYMATIDYMVAAYGPYSASATGGNGFAREPHTAEQRTRPLEMILAPYILVHGRGVHCRNTGEGLIAMANYAIYMATIDYMVAAYGPYSASATGGNGPHSRAAYSPTGDDTCSLYSRTWAWSTLSQHRRGSLSIFACLIAMANYAIYMATIDYMVAAYGPYSASATGPKTPHSRAAYSPTGDDTCSLYSRTWAWSTLSQHFRFMCSTGRVRRLGPRVNSRSSLLLTGIGILRIDIYPRGI
jgi:hypothetical protein